MGKLMNYVKNPQFAHQALYKIKMITNDKNLNNHITNIDH